MQPPNTERLRLVQFVADLRGDMIPLGNRFSYFCAAVSFNEEDVREYLEEPIAALPPKFAVQLPHVRVFLAPYLERAGLRAKTPAGPELFISLERPAESVALPSTTLHGDGEALLVFAVKDIEIADFHYFFYQALAGLAAGAAENVPGEFTALLREELRQAAHGEVDEASWRAKQSAKKYGRGAGRDSKAFREYARQAYTDTLTLFLHGLCCDIDVEPGPRQLASRYLRRRLLALRELFPPPAGYALFPEDPGGKD